MGLRDEVLASKPRSKEELWRVLDALPDDVAAELLELMADPSVQITAIRRVVEEKYPDAPKFKQTTWDGWCRSRRG